jgi:hypothetical protein
LAARLSGQRLSHLAFEGAELDVRTAITLALDAAADPTANGAPARPGKPTSFASARRGPLARRAAERSVDRGVL